MSASSDRQIKDVRDIWGSKENKENPKPPLDQNSYQEKHKYKTLERHLSMKKTIRRKMMRDLKEIEQIRTDQPPPPSIDKPSLWKRLTKGWGNT
ncbi:hypothetical protein FQA39_LY01295 [Lamprigera yunnana]|nr:hypothetical protein FQA39_LY01295 [Lamprigera yunnana]